MDKKSRKNFQSIDYLISVFENSPFALISLDTRLMIVMFNRAAQELSGFRAKEIIGRRVNRIFRFEKLRNIINTLRASEKAAEDGYIINLICKGGREIPIMVSISQLIDSEGKLTGILLVASDLCEIKKLQAKLLAAERLAAITETAISINHEINNPLCSILGNTQLILMEKDRLEPKMVEKLQRIEEEIIRVRGVAERVARITKPVLTNYIGDKKMLDVERSEISGKPSKTKG
ncbi:MAG: PAS domain S-box protein [Candidatus Krumholzibacteria bacterium]|nr:PAS domain S-box protein [Candidatus Krumholzibacteria bacterium]